MNDRGNRNRPHDSDFGTIDPNLMDRKLPWPVRQTVSLLSSGVQVDEAAIKLIKQCAESGPLVYALKFRNMFDIHFLRMRFLQIGLPVPAYVFGLSSTALFSPTKFYSVWKSRFLGLKDTRSKRRPFNTDVLREVLEKGDAAAIFLVDEKTSHDRYIHPEDDPIRILMDLQSQYHGSISILPIHVLYDRRPKSMRSAWSDLLGDPDHPGLLRRILNKFRKWTVPELMVGNPIQLLDRVEEFGSDLSPDEAPFVIRNELIDSVNRRIRVNRGAEKLSLTEIKELVLQDARVQRAVRESALKDGVTEEKVKKRAEAYVDEIAANPRTINHHCLYYVLKFLFWKVFDGIDIKTSEFNSLKKANQNGSLIYVSSHKSHFDYLLIGYLSFINQMSIPYMAAGKNLAFWPVGTVLRTCAAFFIRRTFKGLSLYTHVFAAYLKVLVKEKVNINFYIEGGRSRTGKLIQPRTGMLSFLLQTVDEGAVPDLLFVPSYIGYDLVPEEKSYLKELSGKEKQKETLSQFIRAREVLKRRFGRAYVRFHEPISYKQFCEDILGKDHDASLKENRKLLQEFADYMMHCLVKVSVVTPVELAATSLASAGSATIYRSDIYRNAELIMRVLRQNDSEIAPSLKNLEPALDNAIELFLSSRILLPEDSESDSQHKFVINPNRRANLEFYKNALLNQLWPYSFCAMILLNPAGPGIRSELISKFEILMKLFHKELMYDPISSAKKYVNGVMDFFKKSGWVRDHGPGEASIQNEKPLRLLREVFEDITRTYYYVCTASRDLDKSHSIKDYIKLMSKTSQLDKPDEPAPHFLTVTTENALSKFSEMGIFEYKHAKKLLVSVVEPEQRDNYMQVLNEMRSR